MNKIKTLSAIFCIVLSTFILTWDFKKVPTIPQFPETNTRSTNEPIFVMTENEDNGVVKVTETFILHTLNGEEYELPLSIQYISIRCAESGVSTQTLLSIIAVEMKTTPETPNLCGVTQEAVDYFNLLNDSRYYDWEIDPKQNLEIAINAIKGYYGIYDNWYDTIAAYHDGIDHNSGDRSEYADMIMLYNDILY